MKALLIPVKELSKAKQRLTAHFSQADRLELADALWQDFFEVAAASRRAERVFVVSAEPRVLAHARELGWEAIPETAQVSESASVDFASAWCAERGVEALLRLPVDLPLIQPADIDAIFDAAPGPPGMAIVPSRDGEGTNALLRTPPAVFRSHFGPGSFAKHSAEAARCGAEVRVLRNPRIEVDIDDLEDLRAVSGYSLRQSRARKWLEARGLLANPGSPRTAAQGFTFAPSRGAGR
ncbi:MAG: 2-phospho-L-lactate guanylyltransferase [Bryobacteraceae bacterium]